MIPGRLGLVQEQLGVIPQQLGIIEEQLGVVPQQLGLVQEQLGMSQTHFSWEETAVLPSTQATSSEYAAKWLNFPGSTNKLSDSQW